MKEPYTSDKKLSGRVQAVVWNGFRFGGGVWPPTWEVPMFYWVRIGWLEVRVYPRNAHPKEET